MGKKGAYIILSIIKISFFFLKNCLLKKYNAHRRAGSYSGNKFYKSLFSNISHYGGGIVNTVETHNEGLFSSWDFTSSTFEC